MKGIGVRISEVITELKNARWVWLVAAVMLAVQAMVEISGGLNVVAVWYETFGLRRADVLAGKVWQLVSYAWLHGNVLHAGVNTLGVLLLGARIVHVAGGRAFLNVLAAGVLGGASGHLILAAGGAEAPPLVGMSGAFVAMLLLITTLSPESRMMPLPLFGRSLGAGILAASLLLALMEPTLGVPGFSAVGAWLTARGLGDWFVIGHACHFGGGMAGWLLGRWMLRPRVSLARLRRDRARREARLNDQ